MSTEEFLFSSSFKASAEDLFRWHERPGAFARLNPPWDPVKLLAEHSGIKNGCQVKIGIPLGPLTVPWTLEHQGYDEGIRFQDKQLSGPFHSWLHTHTFTPSGENESILEEHIQYKLPLGSLGKICGSSFTRSKLEQLFRYRHRLTKSDITTHLNLSQKPLSIALSGGSGMVGSALKPFLTTGGHCVRQIVRGDAVSEGSISWSPYEETIDLEQLEGLNAVVHLSGENIASGPWTEGKKKRIRESRIQTTRFLCESLAKLAAPPQVLICASAVGIYGDRGEEGLSEDSGKGEGFLADVCQEWEAATEAARRAGIRVVNLRIGIVISASGGALQKMLLPFQFGLGGTLGSGEHFMSWIALHDLLRLILFSITSEKLEGPVNACSPSPLKNKEFTKTLGKVLHRPTIIPVPRYALKTFLPTLAEEALLASQRALPTKALKEGFSFEFNGLEDALRFTLGKLES
jgi:uncharacterized protein